jgi:hypothetical protein
VEGLTGLLSSVSCFHPHPVSGVDLDVADDLEALFGGGTWAAFKFVVESL